MEKQLFLRRAALLIAGAVVVTMGMQTFHRAFVREKVVSASSVYDLSIVTYENGKTELIYNEYNSYLDNPEHRDLRAVVDAIPLDDPRYPEFKAPSFTLIGASPEKIIYTFDDPDSNGCQRNLLYLDRTKMEKEAFAISRTDYCVKNIVDEWDLTTFFAINRENTKIALGDTATGEIFASIDATNVTSRPGHNWENTRIVFVTGENSPEGDTRKLFLWDVNANILHDKSHVLTTFEGNIVFFHYVRETDAFDMYDGDFDPSLNGEGEFGAYKKLGSLKI